MAYHRHITLFLINITISYVITLIVVLHCNILDNVGITIIVNLMTGFFTSALISYIEFLFKRNENIEYYFFKLTNYYIELERLKSNIKSYESLNDKVETIRASLDRINYSARTQKQNVDIEFLMNSKKNKMFIKNMNNAYEMTFGLDLDALYANYYKQEKKDSKSKKELIASIKKMIEAELLLLDKYLKELTKNDVDKKWIIIKEYAKRRNNKNILEQSFILTNNDN